MVDDNSPPPLEPFLTESEVASILSVSPRALQAWRMNGSGPVFFKLEGVVRYRVSDLGAFIATNFQPPPEPLLTEREVASALNVSHRTLQTWRMNGSGPAFFKLEGVVRYRVSDLGAFIAAGRSASSLGDGK